MNNDQILCLIAKDMQAGRQAAQNCHSLMASDPTNYILPYNLALEKMGVSWFYLGNELKPGDIFLLEEAENLAKKAVKLNPKSIDCQTLLAAILLNSWKWQEAAEVLEHIFKKILPPTYSWRRVTPNEHAQIQRNTIQLWGLFSLRESRKKHELEKSIDIDFSGPNSKSGWNRDWSLFSTPLEMTLGIVDNLRFFEAFSGARRFLDIHRISEPIPNDIKDCYRAFMSELPDHIKAKVAPPRIFGEIGWEIDGQIVNANVLKDIDHVVQLSHFGIFDKLLSRQEHESLRILEIGPGYGGLSFLINAILQAETHVLVDLLDSLGFSSSYLTLACGLNDSTLYFHNGIDPTALSKRQGFSLVPEFLADDLIDQVSFDLIINTGSFGEMSATEVLGYLKIINNVLAPEGFVYDVNNHISDLVRNNFQGEVLNIGTPERIWVKNKDLVPELLNNINSSGRPFQPWGRSARFHSQPNSEWFDFLS